MRQQRQDIFSATCRRWWRNLVNQTALPQRRGLHGGSNTHFRPLMEDAPQCLWIPTMVNRWYPT